MKRALLSVVLIASVSMARAEGGRGGWGGGSSHEGGGIGWGGSGSRGRTVGGRSSAMAPRAPFASNPRAFGGRARGSAFRGGAGRYEWRTYGGRRYAHAFDHGLDWFGFYIGPSFYWTCLFGDRWWWYDPALARWDFWWGGYWWWPNPAGVAYIYVNGAYTPYDEAEVKVEPPPSVGPPPTPVSSAAPSTSPSAAGPTPSGTGSWKSPDGRRMVQVTGSSAEAFLYDTSGAAPAYMRGLGENVVKVRFSGGTKGKPLQILVDRRDGSFDLYSEKGDILNSSSPQGKSPSAAPSGDSSPPSAPPTPGQ